MKIGTALPGASVVALVVASLLSFVPNSEAYFLFTGRIKSKYQEIDFSERPFNPERGKNKNKTSCTVRPLRPVNPSLTCLASLGPFLVLVAVVVVVLSLQE